MRRFDSLSEREVLALAIGMEAQDAQIYADYADGLRQEYPATADLFEKVREQEISHRDRLTAMYREKFGEHIPLLRREDVRGFVFRRPIWLMRPLGLKAVRKQAAAMEAEVRQFYTKAAQRATDIGVRDLLNKLADEERSHEELAEELGKKKEEAGVWGKEDEAKRRLFVLQVIQPGLAGLMDGSVSTLAPVFAAAFATHESHYPFVVGLAASVGAGISMAFAEAVSDDGSLTGRGKPVMRGFICGLMTALGGIGHTLPFLIPQFHIAFAVAVIVVAVELAAISWIRYRFMDTPFLSAAFQVIVGGVLVFITGVLIGKS